MRRQIARAILGVAVLLVIGLGVPLAATVQRFYEDRATVDLQRRAAKTIAEITVPIDRVQLANVAAEGDETGSFSVYDQTGHRVFGSGPRSADEPVLAALRGRSAAKHDNGQFAVAAPITQRTSETVVGAVRVAEPASVVDDEVRRAWLAMAGAVALALAGAALLARWQGRRLAEPVVQLASHAERLGHGAFTQHPKPSGIAEVDAVADALTETGERLATLLARERAFSADVAHQLRTPLTGLRLSLERLTAENERAIDIEPLLIEVGRLESTVEHLLALARDRQPVAETLDVRALLDDVSARYERPLRDAGRDLRVEGTSSDAEVLASNVAMTQVLDVLVDNAVHHGAGTVTVRSRPAAGGIVIEVTDEGSGMPDDVDVFRRRHAKGGHGIGLALARSIAESEGGRLLLVRPRPPVFQIVLATRSVDPPT